MSLTKADKQAEYCNLPKWHSNGYDGRGVNVLNCEGFTDHGKISRKRILQAAPGANVFSGNISGKTKNGVYVDVNVMLDDGKGNKTKIPFEDFIRDNNIKVLNASFQPTPFQYPGYKVNSYWKELIDKYDLCIFCSSGNEYEKDKKMDNDGEYLWYIGALNTDSKGLPKRAGYSNGGEGLDFVDFTGDWAGTSFSSPYLAGKTALIRQKYPNMNRKEVYQYIKDHCVDLGESGTDTLYGNGLLIMPDIDEIYGVDKNTNASSNGQSNKGDNMDKEYTVKITSTKVLVNGIEKSVNRVMVNNENYIRLRDFDDVLGVCKIDYDSKKKLPIVKK